MLPTVAVICPVGWSLLCSCLAARGCLSLCLLVRTDGVFSWAATVSPRMRLPGSRRIMMQEERGCVGPVELFAGSEPRCPSASRQQCGVVSQIRSHARPRSALPASQRTVCDRGHHATGPATVPPRYRLHRPALAFVPACELCLPLLELPTKDV